MVLRFLGYIFGIGTVLFLTAAAAVAWYVSDLAKGVPDYDVLAHYEPPVMSRVHAADGELIAEYARERRMYLPIQTIPERLRLAVIATEDQNFYTHPGIDLVGIARAAMANLRSDGGPLEGGSTITQQVAKNFLLTADQNWDRKIQEAILAIRIENAYSKEKILELYLNEVNFGMGAYGVAAASLTYFGKSVHELSLAEAAYLAAVLKGPSNYHPFRYPDAAIERRNYVIGRMVAEGYATAEEGAFARSEPLGVVTTNEAPRVFAADSFHGEFSEFFEANYADSIARTGGISTNVASYFAEEVRRELLTMYGEERLYGGGLSVRTSLDPELQILARKSLMDGLVAFDTSHGWRGPVTTIEMGADWGVPLAEVPGLYDVIEWRQAVVLGVTGEGAEIGLKPGRDGAGRVLADRLTGTIPATEMRWAGSPAEALHVGDVVFVEPLGQSGSTYRLRQVPQLNGALVAMHPQTGRVLAMVGGFSFAESQFNRATQAMRQPGSSFKPVVYAAALDNGYTPSSVVMDAPIEIDQGSRGIWRPENYSNEFYGPSTLRTGIELSRNVMTVRLANDMGMPLVSEYAERFGIYEDLPPLLSMALGSGETTVLRMVAAYAVFANGGRQVRPTLIDRIQDRFGQTIFRYEDRTCAECSAAAWANQPEPTIVDNRQQILDPMTAYQVTSMMEGVVQRGTATVVRDVGRPIAGKTGTTNDYNDAWFIGFSPNLVVGVFLGFDTPASLGSGNTGGTLAAPIFAEFMKVALADEAPTPFPVPQGISLIPIDRRTGLRSEGGNGVILEAFKPGTAPPDSYSIIGYTDELGRPLTVAPEADRAVVLGTGGLY
ncbi:MAG: penicillin-binding protein 1A [Bauldia sp.]|nr:penicillin-binding protein 1A [Bauldia sp.]